MASSTTKVVFNMNVSKYRTFQSIERFKRTKLYPRDAVVFFVKFIILRLFLDGEISLSSVSAVSEFLISSISIEASRGSKVSFVHRGIYDESYRI